MARRLIPYRLLQALRRELDADVSTIEKVLLGADVNRSPARRRLARELHRRGYEVELPSERPS